MLAVQFSWQTVLGSIRKPSKPACRQASNVPPTTVSTLTSCLNSSLDFQQRWIVIWKCKPNKPFLPYVFSHSFFVFGFVFITPAKRKPEHWEVKSSFCLNHLQLLLCVSKAVVKMSKNPCLLHFPGPTISVMLTRHPLIPGTVVYIY